jgi:NAD dependent epimerase/dehydratase
MSFAKKNVLITGAAGFIGSHLVEALAAEGCGRLSAFVHYNAQNRWGHLEDLPRKTLREIVVMTGDLRDPQSVRRAMAGVDVVFHLGALISIPYSYEAPGAFFETNALGSMNVFRAALDAGVGRIIQTSTSEVYGTARYVPIDEGHPLQAQSPYAASKIAADKIAESFRCSFGLPVTTVRPFNTYGPRQSARALIPAIIIQVLRGPGRPIRLGSLAPIRDLNYVEDTVRGFILAAQCARAEGETINLGSGRGVSVGRLARTIIALLGSRNPIVLERRRLRPPKSEVGRLVCDSSKARRLLRWWPRVDLEEGLLRTREAIMRSPAQYKAGIYNI